MCPYDALKAGPVTGHQTTAEAESPRHPLAEPSPETCRPRVYLDSNTGLLALEVPEPDGSAACSLGNERSQKTSQLSEVIETEVLSSNRI